MPYSPNVDYRAVARRKALKYGLNPHIFERQIGVESVGYSPAVISGRTASPAGAQGIAQFMPATARGLGVNPLHPKQALDAAAKLMAGYVRRYGSYANALRAYNAGPGAIGSSHGFAETNRYVQEILRGHDPGHLGSPRAPGVSSPGRRGGGGVTITRHPASVSGNAGLTVGAPDMSALSALLAQQSQPQQPQTTMIAPPSFSSQSYLKTGAMSLPATQQPQQDNGLAAKLAALGGMTGDATLGSGQTITPGSVTVSGQAPSGVRGHTLVIGDSLEVGTFPLLKQKLGGKVHGIAVGGKPSAWGIRQLRAQFKTGRYQNVVFDMGTNDATVGELRKSLRQLTNIVGDAHIFVSTVNTPFHQDAKNQLIREFGRSHPNVTVIPWHGITHGGANLPDHIHGAYGRRANVIAGALGYQPGSAGGAHVRGNGHVTYVGAAAQGVNHPVKSFLAALAAYTPISATTGKVGHTKYVSGRPGVVSDHYGGNAEDLGSVANHFPIGGGRGNVIAARAIQLASGMSYQRALQVAKAGGIHNYYPKTGRWAGRHIQIIWRAADHYDHVHVGVA